MQPNEPIERRDHLAGELEPDERLLGAAETLGERIEDEGWGGRRESKRNEGRYLLATHRGSLVSSRGSIRHASRSLGTSG